MVYLIVWNNYKEINKILIDLIWIVIIYHKPLIVKHLEI